jgi:hypothetical protein
MMLWLSVVFIEYTEYYFKIILTEFYKPYAKKTLRFSDSEL